MLNKERKQSLNYLVKPVDFRDKYFFMKNIQPLYEALIEDLDAIQAAIKFGNFENKNKNKSIAFMMISKLSEEVAEFYENLKELKDEQTIQQMLTPKYTEKLQQTLKVNNQLKNKKISNFEELQSQFIDSGKNTN